MKTINSSFSQLVLFSIFALIISSNVQAQDPEPIGLMLSTVGVVTAEDLDGNVRRLQRRSPVYEGDTLITANRGRAQVRFNDRGLIALQPNTSFFIEEHNFEGQEDGTESAVYSLLRGGLQAITGLIGHNNRDRYQVSTPIATIGLRGTHWAATFCTTACDGNAPGLYGGVADGGIDVCNGGGCTAVETNTYFYTPNANTRATTLLAPPSVVFAAAEDDGEDDEESGEIAETDGNEGGDGEADDDIASFVERAGVQDDTAQRAISVTPENANNDDASDLVAENQETVVEEEITASTQSSAAPLGSVVALASARGNPDNLNQSAALNILVQPTGGSPSSATAVLPIAGFVDATDPLDDARTTTALGALAFNLEQDGCNPCLYATAGLQRTTASLVESIETTVDGVDVFLGRWSGDALLFNSGFDNANGNLNALQDHHYAIALADGSAAFSPVIPSVDLIDENTIGVFSLLEATSPTDANSVAGTLDRAELVMDFYQQIVTNMELDISFADERQLFAGLVNAFSFAEGSVAGLFAPLEGYCTGGSCGQITEVSGDTSLSFIGNSSEHILGAYSLDTQAFDQSVFGAYLLGLDFTFDPLAVTDLTSAPANDGFLLFSGTEDVAGLYLPLLSDFIEVGGSNNVQLANVYDTTKVLAGFSYTDLDGCDPCLFDISGGRLEERGSVSLLGSEFSYGTWSLTDFNVSDTGEPITLTDVVSYLYSPTDIQLAPDLLTSSSPSVVSFSYLGGPSPSDETGALGVINSIDLGLDLYFQRIDKFDIEVSIAERLYEAGMIGIADLAAVLNGAEVGLKGSCTGGACLTGELLTGSANLGVAAVSSSGSQVGLVGSFALQNTILTALAVGVDAVSAVVGEVPSQQTEVPSQYTAAGLFVLQQNQVEDHPDYVNNPQFVLADGGVAAFATIATQSGAFAPIGTVADVEDTDIGLTAVNGNDNLVVSLTDIDEVDSGHFNITEGVLTEYSDVSTSAFSASLGRWDVFQSDLFIDGMSRTHSPEAHFAYSDNPTNFDLLSFSELENPILQYSLLEATAPTDQAGIVGVLNDLSIEINLIAQVVTSFSLDISIANTIFEASIFGPRMLNDNHEILLRGSCSGGYCGSSTDIFGAASLGFIGDQADGILGHYGLLSYSGNQPPAVGDDFDFDQMDFADIGIAGVYLAAQDSVFEAPVDYLFPSFDTPAIAKYLDVDRYVEDDQGLEGDLFVDMRLDLFTQTLAYLGLEFNIGDRQYDARYFRGGYNDVGIDFADLLTDEIPLRGNCYGGDCAQVFSPDEGTFLAGSAYISPFGSEGEGFFGDFDLSECLPWDECSPSSADIQANGDFVLGLYEVYDHPAWYVDPVGTAALAPEVAAISGTLFSSSTTFHPFSGVLDPLDGGAFSYINHQNLLFDSRIVDSVVSSASDCDVCSFQAQDAVVINLGRVFHDYQYLGYVENEEPIVSWATWANNDTNEGWLTDFSGNALSSNQFVNTVYADHLTQSPPMYALTGNDDYASYSYAGGPPAVDDRSEFGEVTTMSLSVDFFSQTLSDFSATFVFGDYYDANYRSFSIDQGVDVGLAPVMEISLTGSCYGGAGLASGCGSSSGYDELDGEASLALIGDNAEQIIGALSAWSNGIYNPEGTYSLESGFVLNQDFDPSWVISEPFRANTNESTYVAFAPIFANSGGSQFVPVPALFKDDAPNEGDVGINLTNHMVDSYYSYTTYQGFSSNEFYSALDDSRFFEADIFAGIDIFSASEFFRIEEGSLLKFGVIEGQYPVSSWFDPDLEFRSNNYTNYFSYSSDYYLEPAFFVEWGLWSTGDIDQNLNCCALGDANYTTYQPWAIAYQDSITDFAAFPNRPAQSFDSIGTYHYLGGPPSYGSNGLGTITGVRMDWDFDSQTLSDFWIQANDTGNTFLASYDGSYLDLGDGSFLVPLNGNCLLCNAGVDLPVSGETLVTFLGDNAEGALGSFGLSDTSEAYSVAGVYVLQQEINDHWVNNPLTSPAPAGGAVVFAGTMDTPALDPLVLGFGLDADNTADLTNVIAFDHNHPNSVAGFDVASGCGGTCAYQVTEGELFTYDNSNAPQFAGHTDAYWGRWETQEEIDLAGVMTALTDFQHWAYSPDPSDKSGEIWSSNAEFQYEYNPGVVGDTTIPTDHLGNEGYIDNIYMSLDFMTQQISGFYLDATVNANAYSVSLDSAVALDTNASAQLGLSGYVNTYDMASGTAAVTILGSEADAAIGTFGLYGGSVYSTMNGAFFLENTGLVPLD